MCDRDLGDPVPRDQAEQLARLGRDQTGAAHTDRGRGEPVLGQERPDRGRQLRHQWTVGEHTARAALEPLLPVFPAQPDPGLARVQCQQSTHNPPA